MMQFSLALLTAIFPGGPGLAGNRMSPFWILLELRVMQEVVSTGAVRCTKSSSHRQQTEPNVLQAGCPSSRPTNIVKALKGKVSHFTDLLT